MINHVKWVLRFRCFCEPLPAFSIFSDERKFMIKETEKVLLIWNRDHKPVTQFSYTPMAFRQIAELLKSLSFEGRGIKRDEKCFHENVSAFRSQTWMELQRKFIISLMEFSQAILNVLTQESKSCLKSFALLMIADKFPSQRALIAIHWICGKIVNFWKVQRALTVGGFKWICGIFQRRI